MGWGNLPKSSHQPQRHSAPIDKDLNPHPQRTMLRDAKGKYIFFFRVLSGMDTTGNISNSFVHGFRMTEAAWEPESAESISVLTDSEGSSYVSPSSPTNTSGPDSSKYDYYQEG